MSGKKQREATPAKENGAGRKRRWKPTLLFWLGLFTSLSLGVSMLLLALSYRLVLGNYYMRSLQRELLEAMQRMKESSFSEETLDGMRQEGIRVLLVDPDSRQIAYEDMYFLLEEPGPPTPQGDKPDWDTVSGASQEAERDDVRMKSALELVQRVNGQLEDGEEGYFFSTDSLDNYERSLMQSGLQSKALYLNGRKGAYYFSLCLPIESVSTALTLGIRFASIITGIVWLIGLTACYFFYRHITKPAKEVERTADQISRLDFSKRCPPAHTRELNGISDSINRMSDELQDYLNRLRETNEQLGAELDERVRQQQLTRDLIGNLSHDLKTPIAVISGYAEGLAEGVAATDEQRERYLQMILKESEHMQTVVNKMLQLTRLEAKADPVELVDFDLSELTDSVLQIFTHEIEKEGLHVECRLEEALFVHSDYERIRQVIVNYLQNSVYHINGGTRIRVVSERREHAAVLRVANSSASIPEEQSADLWEKLYRGDYARARSHGEAGLGLSIVRNGMERLGQPYGFRNLEDEGMVEFYIELPLTEAPADGKDTEV